MFLLTLSHHTDMLFSVLQSDMQRGVHGRLMDNSTSVREAAVELLGRFVLSRPQLTEQYYDMLIERILVSSIQISCARLGCEVLQRFLICVYQKNIHQNVIKMWICLPYRHVVSMHVEFYVSCSLCHTLLRSLLL